MSRKKYLWAIMYGAVLTSFTVYVLMDTFIIKHVYSKISSNENNSSFDHNTSETTESGTSEYSLKESVEKQSSDITEITYKDDNISITITEYREYNTSIYVADVKVSSAEYLKTALAQNSYGRNVTEKTSEIAENNGAILAINGDNYGSQENGYVLRNGVVYRSTASGSKEDLAIHNNGTFSIVTEGETSADELCSNGVQQILSFGPALVADNMVMVTEDEEVGKAKASNPRTAIGILDNLHYIFVVSDGRTSESEGLSLYELAEFMKAYGASTAYNLDGGGSSTMYFNGKVINNPTSSGRSIKERSVSDIVYIGY